MLSLPLQLFILWDCIDISIVFNEHKVSCLAHRLENRLLNIRFRRQRKFCLKKKKKTQKIPRTETFFRQNVTIPTLPPDLCSWDCVRRRHAAFRCLCRARAARAARGSPGLEGESTSYTARGQQPRRAAGPGWRCGDLELSLSYCCLLQLSFLQWSFFKALQKRTT